MMILRLSPASPFGRKVRIAISLLGFGDQTKVEPADPTDSSDSLRRQNPLGKIPVLIDEDGTAFYDSCVILDFLDERAGGGKIVPREPRQRLAALRLQALCDGILDASILTVYESRWRASEHHEQKWFDHQAGKVARGLAALESAPPALDASPQALPQCRTDRACRRSRLPRFPFWPRLAWRASAPGSLARSFRGARAGLRRDNACGLAKRIGAKTKNAGAEPRGFSQNTMRAEFRTCSSSRRAGCWYARTRCR